MMDSTVLDVNGLDKWYGRVHAVNQLSFNVPKGSVYGILGPNGSGKTTTLGIILGVILANEGKYTWLGGVKEVHARKRIGAILETPNFYPYLSAEDNLKITCRIKDVGYERIEPVLKQVNLLERKNSPFKTFSLGMKQRLAIAAALLNEPEVLVLDEPTNGLDPAGIAEVRSLIAKIAEQGITVLLASHLLDEVEKVCTDVLVLQRGSKLFEGKVEEVLSPGGAIHCAADDMESLSTKLKSFPEILNIKESGSVFQLSVKEGFTASQLNQELAKANIYLTHLEAKKKSLESYFLELTDNENA